MQTSAHLSEVRTYNQYSKCVGVALLSKTSKEYWMVTIAALTGGLTTFLSFGFSHITSGTRIDLIGIGVGAHSVLIALLLLVAGPRNKDGVRANCVLVLILTLCGGVFALLVNPYLGIVLVATGRAFLNSGIATIVYIGWAKDESSV
jgi:hypothetical protein